MPLGALVNHVRERLREGVLGELQREIPPDGRHVEVPRRDLAAQVVRDEVVLEREERMVRLRQLRRPRGHDQQHPHVVDPARQVAEKIRRRRIGPVHVVEAEDDGLHPRDLLEERADLALEPLLRSARGVGRQAARRRIVLRRRHDLRVPAGRQRAHQPRQAAELFVVLKAVEHLEHRQVGFAAGQALRAAAAADAHRVAAIGERAHERVDDGGLADARPRPR